MFVHKPCNFFLNNFRVHNVGKETKNGCIIGKLGEQKQDEVNTQDQLYGLVKNGP